MHHKPNRNYSRCAIGSPWPTGPPWIVRQHVDISFTMDASTQSFAVSVASLAIVALASTPHISHAAQLQLSAKQKYQALTEKYEDEDGVATEDSQEAFSDLRARTLLVIASLAASALATASAVLTTIRSDTAHQHFFIRQWLQVASWVRSCSSKVDSSAYRSTDCSIHPDVQHLHYSLTDCALSSRCMECSFLAGHDCRDCR